MAFRLRKLLVCQSKVLRIYDAVPSPITQWSERPLREWYFVISGPCHVIETALEVTKLAAVHGAQHYIKGKHSMHIMLVTTVHPGFIFRQTAYSPGGGGGGGVLSFFVDT